MGKGIKTRRRLSEERWDVSRTGKFFRFPETDEGERGRIVGESDSIAH